MKCDSEYDAAMLLVGSWHHWLRLKECNWFKPHVESWEKEREIREIALGKKILIEEAEAGNVSAARVLYGQSKAKKGRPSKQDKAKLSREDADLDEFIKKSYAKVSLIKK